MPIQSARRAGGALREGAASRLLRKPRSAESRARRCARGFASPSSWCSPGGSHPSAPPPRAPASASCIFRCRRPHTSAGARSGAGASHASAGARRTLGQCSHIQVPMPPASRCQRLSHPSSSVCTPIPTSRLRFQHPDLRFQHLALQRRLDFAEGGESFPSRKTAVLQRRMSFAPDVFGSRNAKVMRLWSAGFAQEGLQVRMSKVFAVRSALLACQRRMMFASGSSLKKRLAPKTHELC